MKNYFVLSAAFLLCALFGFTSCSDKPVRREMPREKRAGLMVLNFKNTTAGKNAKEYQPWEFGIPSMVMTDIESIGLFNIISRENLKDIVKQQEFELSGLVDPEKAVKIGRLASAKYILAGSFTEMNGTLRMEARVLSVEKGIQLGAASVTGTTDTFFEMEKMLVIKVSAYLNAMLTINETSLIRNNIETKSVKASLNNYAGELAVIKSGEFNKKGETELAERELKEARKSFRDALKHDPGYERAKANLTRLTMGAPMTL